MTLHFYKIGTDQPVLTVENAQSYTADSILAADGTAYAPLAEGYELSGKADCSETLRVTARRILHKRPVWRNWKNWWRH